MLLDYDFANCTRRCAVGGRALAPGESYYSTLQMERGVAVRRDYAAESWSGPPAEALAWWRSCVDDGAAQAQLAPHDVLLNLFTALAEEPAEADFRYVLGLLLLRRRLVKFDGSRRDALGEVLVLDCPRRQEQFELLVATPSPERMAELEQRLGDLLFGGAKEAGK